MVTGPWPQCWETTGSGGDWGKLENTFPSCLVGMQAQSSQIFFYLFMYLCIYLFLTVLGLYCCAWAFSSCGERGLLFFEVWGFLIAVASLTAEHKL